MKNYIGLDIDTERDEVFMFTKKNEQDAPTTAEEAKNMVITDINHIASALCIMIEMAHINNYIDKNDVLPNIQSQLSSLLNKND